MKIRMNVSSAGPAGVRNADRVYEVEDAEAQQLIAGGYAVAVVAPEPREDEGEGWTESEGAELAALREENAALKEQLAKPAAQRAQERIEGLTARVEELETENAALKERVEASSESSEGEESPPVENAAAPAPAAAERATNRRQR